MRLMAYDFAGVAHEFCGGLRLKTFHGGLWQLTTAAWGSNFVACNIANSRVDRVTQTQYRGIIIVNLAK